MPEDNLIHHFNHFSSFTQGKSKLLKYPIEILASKVVLKKQTQQKIHTKLKSSSEFDGLASNVFHNCFHP